MIRLKLFAFDDERIDPFHDGLLRIHKQAGTRIVVQVAGQPRQNGKSQADILVECTYAAPGWASLSADEQAPARRGRPEVLSRVLAYAKKCLERGGYDIILLDNTLSGPSGDQRDYGVDVLLPIARKGSPDALIAIITGFPMITDERVDAIRRAFSGPALADMWLPKMSEALCDTLCSIILLVARGKADRERRLALEPLDLQNRQRLAGGVVPDSTVFASPAMTKVIADAIQGARNPWVHIFLLGPTGAGKKHLIDVIRANDPRGESAPWELVNCGGISRDSHIAYLFGHKRGDFTSSTRDNPGALRRADGGNLILDEVHNLSKEAQQALLHVVDQGDARDFAGRSYKVSVRIVAASNRGREELERDILPDFLNRLWLWAVEIPSLNSRRDDVVPLAMEFAREAGRNARQEMEFAPEALDCLKGHDWARGEVRQLRNTVLNAAVRALNEESRRIGLGHVTEALKALSLGQQAAPNPAGIVQASVGEGWLGELHTSKLRQLCQEVWTSQGSCIGNNPDNIVAQLACSPYYLRAVLAAFHEALREDRAEIFNSIFGLLRPPREAMGLRQYLQQKSRQFPTVFVPKSGTKNYGVRDLVADGKMLRQAGFIVDLG